MAKYDDMPLLDKLQAKVLPTPPIAPSPLRILLDRLRAHQGRAGSLKPSHPMDVDHGPFV